MSAPGCVSPLADEGLARYPEESCWMAGCYRRRMAPGSRQGGRLRAGGQPDFLVVADIRPSDGIRHLTTAAPGGFPLSDGGWLLI